MANRMKEDEKNEKIIRGLLKLAPNRRCINCHSLGPQYVCTNFWTFVCTTCSGIHREFTHRVKSISMAKFSSQEVSALQAGGNERAKEFYFKEWDPQRHSVPDSSNVDRLRDFIKHVYVDRRYTGERSTDRPPRIKGDDTYRGDSRSPPYEDTYGSRYNERSAPGSRYSYDERRSPGYEQENRRYSDVYRRSPRRFEIVDDRVRDDRFGNGNQNWKSEDRRFSEGPSKQGERSPNHQKDPEMSSPPMVRPVRDILGDDTPPLRVGDPPKSNGGRSIDGSAQTQRTTSSSSMGSADGNSVELKRANSGSLIDFNVDPEPPVATVSQDPFSGQSAPQPTATPLVDGGNWASFDFATQEKVHQASSNAPAPVSALSQLEALVTPAAATLPTLSVGGGLDSLARPTSVGQGPTIQQHQSSLFNMPVGEVPKNQIWMSCVGPNAQVNAPVPITAQTAQLSQVVPMQPQETTAGVQSLPPPVEAKQSGRQALPEDLFSGAPVSAPVWRSVPPQAMGFGTQYPTATLQAMQAFPQMSKSTNPFDLVNEPIPVRAPTFPSMVSLQGALPNIAAPSPLLRSSSFGAPSPQWVPQSPSYPSTLPPGAYMAQQAPNSMVPLGQHGIASFGGEGAAFGTYGAGQRPPLRGSLPSTPNSFSSLGGNPFG